MDQIHTVTWIMLEENIPSVLKKEKWRKLYKELHFLAKSEMLTQQNFHNKHYADLKEAKKSINLFSPTKRSFILALSWYLKKDNQICLIKNYQYLNWFFKKKNFSMAAMSPLLKIKQVKKNKFYFFHHGLGSLDPIIFQKITSFYLKKKIFLLLLSEKKFIQRNQFDIDSFDQTNLIVKGVRYQLKARIKLRVVGENKFIESFWLL